VQAPGDRPSGAAALRALEIVRTPRLILTRIVAADADDLRRMHGDAQVMRTLGGVRTDAQTAAVLTLLAAHWEAHGFGYWMARDAASGAFVGRGGLRHVIVGGVPEVEVGYALMPPYWGQGYATELGRAAVDAGLGLLGCTALVGFTLPTNDLSRRVLERLGFAYERDTIWAGLPHVLYRLTDPPA